MNHLQQNNKGFTLIELIVVMAVFLFVIGSAIGIFISTVQYQKKVLTEQQLLNQISYAEEYMSKSLRMAKAELNENCLIGGDGVDYSGYVYLLTRYNSASPVGYRGIKFVKVDVDSSGNSTAVCEEFFLDGAGTAADPFILKEKKDNGAPVALTPENLKIISVKFLTNGTASLCLGSDSCGVPDPDTTVVQPRVTILMKVQVANTPSLVLNVPNLFSIETAKAEGAIYNAATGGPALPEPTLTIQTTVSQRNLNAK